MPTPREIKLKLLLDTSQALKDGQIIYADLRKLFNQKIDIGINIDSLIQAKQKIQEVQKASSTKIKMDIDTDLFSNKVEQNVAKVRKAKKEIEEDLRPKISSSVDFTELDKFFKELKDANLTAQNTKLNVGVKVDYAQLLEGKQRLVEFQREFGELNNLRFNIKQDSNIFNQINQSIKALSPEVDLIKAKIEGLKLNPKMDSKNYTSELNKIKSGIENLETQKNKLAKTTDINVELKRQNVDNQIQGLKNSLAGVSKNNTINFSIFGNPAGALGLVTGAAARVPKALTVAIYVAGIQAALSALSALASAANSAISSAFDVSGKTQQNLIGLEATSKSYIRNQANVITSAQQEKLTVDQLAQARGISTQALTEEVKQSGGASAASKALKADTLALKQELLDIKVATKDYKEELQFEEKAKKDLEKANKIQIKDLEIQVKSIEQVVKSYQSKAKSIDEAIRNYEKESKSVDDLIKNKERDIKGINTAIKALEAETKIKLEGLNISDKQLKKQQDSIDLRNKEISVIEKQISAEEAKLNKNKSQQEKAFDLSNKPKTLEIDKQSLELEKQLSKLNLQKSLLNDNAKLNKDQLETIQNQQEQIRNKLDGLREEKAQISISRQELINTITEQQSAQRETIEAKKEEIEKQKEIQTQQKDIYDQAKIQAEDLKQSYQDKIEAQKLSIDSINLEIDKQKEIKDGIQAQIEKQKEVKDGIQAQIDKQKEGIDEIKDKIENAKLQLDLDTSPIESKIEQIKAKIEEITQQFSDIQEKISQKEQDTAELNAERQTSGSGGRGGSISVPSFLAKQLQDEVNRANKGDFSTLTKDKELLKQLQDLKKQNLSPEDFKSTLERTITKFGVERAGNFYDKAVNVDKTSSLNRQELLQAAKDLSVLGFTQTADDFEKVIRTGADFLATDPEKKVGDYIRSLRELTQGQFNSFRENFGVSASDFSAQAQREGLLKNGRKAYNPNDTSFSQDEFTKQFSPEELAKILTGVTKTRGIEGLDKENARSFPVALENFQTQIKDSGLALLGFTKEFDKNVGAERNKFEEGGLFDSVQEAIGDLTQSLDNPDFKSSLKELGKSAGSFIREVGSADNIKNFISELTKGTKWLQDYLGNESNRKLLIEAGKDFINLIKDFGGFLQGFIDKFGEFVGIESTSKKKERYSGYNTNREGIESVLAGDNAQTKFNAKVNGINEDIKTSEDFQRRLNNPKTSEEDKKTLKFGIENLKKAIEEGKKDVKGYYDYLESTGEKTTLNITDANRATLKSLGLDYANFSTQASAKIAETATKSTLDLNSLSDAGRLGFVRLADGAKVQLSELGLANNATAEQIKAKFEEVKISTVANFNAGRILSEAELTLLAQTNNTTIDQIKLKSEEIRTTLQTKFQEGRNLSEIELATLAQNNGKTVEGIKQQQGTIREKLQTSFKEGKDLSEEQLKILAEINNTTVEKIKTEFAKAGGHILEPIKQGTDSANTALGGTKDKVVDLRSAFEAFTRIKLDGIINQIQSIGNIIYSQNGALSGLRDMATQFGLVKREQANVLSFNGGKGTTTQTRANGGLITGGSGVRDDVPLLAMGGEYVLRQQAVRELGVDFMNQLNANPRQLMNQLSGNLANNSNNYYQNSNSKTSNSTTNNYSPNFNLPSSGDSKIDIYMANDLARRNFKSTFA